MRNWQSASSRRRRRSQADESERIIDKVEEEEEEEVLAPAQSTIQTKKSAGKVVISRIERRAEGALADGTSTLEALRALCWRMLLALEPRSDGLDSELRDIKDTVSAEAIVSWIVSDEGNDAGTSEEAYWLGQALVNHGLLLRVLNGVGNLGPSGVAGSGQMEAVRALRQFDPDAKDAWYRFDRFALCPYRLRIEIHGARNLPNVHMLRRAGSAYVRGVLGRAIFFESRVADAELSPVWDEVYELGCRDLDERIELQVLDRDAAGVLTKKRGKLLGSVDLGPARDWLSENALTTDPTSPTSVNKEKSCAFDNVDAESVVNGGRCVFRRARLSRTPHYLPLESPSGGHGSDSAMLAARCTLLPKRDLGISEMDEGTRGWILKARFVKATNVAYDLAETWGLQFCMRAKLIAGDKEAQTSLADKELSAGACEWDEHVRIETQLTRQSELAHIVICERARSDLLERRIAFATVALSSLPVVDAVDESVGQVESSISAEQRALDAAFFQTPDGKHEELAFAPPKWIELEKAAGGSRSSPLRARNGTVLASLWLERQSGSDSEREEKMSSRRAKLLRSAKKRSKRNQSPSRSRKGEQFTKKMSFGQESESVLHHFRWVVPVLAVLIPYLTLSRPLVSARLAWLLIRFALRLVASLLKLPFGLAGCLVIAGVLGLFAPRLLGLGFSYLITNVVVARGARTIRVPKIEAKSIALSAWFERGEARRALPFAHTGALLLRIVVRGFRFGNPAGFRRDHLLRVEHVSIDLAIPLVTLWALPRLFYDVFRHKTIWSPFPSVNWERRRRALEAHEMSRDAARRNSLPAIRFERFDFEDAELNFEMHHGELNINGIARLLAEADAFADADRELGQAAWLRRQRKDDTATTSNNDEDAALSPGSSDSESEEHVHNLTKLPRPNQLVVTIRSVRGLFTRGTISPGGNTVNDDQTTAPDHTSEGFGWVLYNGQAHVEVRARSEKQSTRAAQCIRGEAKWHESALRFQVTDPSSVIRIEVRSEGGAVVFSWIMTAKWLVSVPTYCEHADDWTPLSDGRHGAKGWITLRDRKTAAATSENSVGNSSSSSISTNSSSANTPPPPPPPELWIEIEWARVQFDASKRVRQTAMEQLATNGEESALRMVDFKMARAMLADFPIKVDVFRVTVRDMELHIKDLFMGRRGQAEVGSGARNAIKLPLTDITGVLRHPQDKANDPKLVFGKGVDLSEFLERFFVKGVAPELMRQNALNTGIQHITSAFAKQLWLGGAGLSTLSERFPIFPTNFSSSAAANSSSGDGTAGTERRSLTASSLATFGANRVFGGGQRIPYGSKARESTERLLGPRKRQTTSSQQTTIKEIRDEKQETITTRTTTTTTSTATTVTENQQKNEIQDETQSSVVVQRQERSSSPSVTAVSVPTTTKLNRSLSMPPVLAMEAHPLPLSPPLSSWQANRGKRKKKRRSSSLSPGISWSSSTTADESLADAFARIGVEVDDDDADLAAPAIIEGDLEHYQDFFAKNRRPAIQPRWHTFKFSLRNSSLFFSLRDLDAHLLDGDGVDTFPAPTVRRLSLDGVLAIRLQGRSVMLATNADSPLAEVLGSSRSTVMLTKHDHHVFLRAPNEANDSTLNDWRTAIAACLPAACQESTAGGLATSGGHFSPTSRRAQGSSDFFNGDDDEDDEDDDDEDIEVDVPTLADLPEESRRQYSTDEASTIDSSSEGIRQGSGSAQSQALLSSLSSPLLRAEEKAAAWRRSFRSAFTSTTNSNADHSTGNTVSGDRTTEL